MTESDTFLGSPNSTASIRRGVAGGRARAVLPGPRQFKARCLLGVRVDIACWPKDCQFVSHHVSEQPDRWLLCVLSAALLACSLRAELLSRAVWFSGRVRATWVSAQALMWVNAGLAGKTLDGGSRAREGPAMTTLKVIEVLSQSDKSWEDATPNAVNDAAKSVRGIKSIYISNSRLRSRTTR
jgi:Dodecin